MTTESELIRRYSGAFTEQECDEYVNYINTLEKNSFLAQDTSCLLYTSDAADE